MQGSQIYPKKFIQSSRAVQCMVAGVGRQSPKTGLAEKLSRAGAGGEGPRLCDESMMTAKRRYGLQLTRHVVLACLLRILAVKIE